MKDLMDDYLVCFDLTKRKVKIIFAQ